MNADRLLAHFERISEAPDAIARLRRFILDLAVRGKLVEQDAEDEPAEELLEQIAEARFSLIHAGKSKKQNQLFDEQADDPFGLPYGWQWARLPEVADFSAGRTPARNEDKFWNPGFFHWVSIGDMEDGRPLSVTKELVSKLAGEAVFRSQLEPVGTMIMSFKLTIGKMARLAVPAFHNEAIISIHPYMKSLDPYLFKVIPLFARSADSKGAIKGATLNRDSISRIPIPLPPLAEQHRIVAKVDELMALCDQLEAARQKREQGREHLVAATLQRLNQPAADLASFRQDASFALQVLPSLTTTPAQIKQLRQTILNLAVRGKLVEQDPEDEPAEELLTLLATEKQTQRNGRNWEANVSVAADPLFDMPRGWYLTVVAATARRVTVGYVGPMKDQYVADGIPFLRSQNVRANRFREDGLVYISRDFHSKIAKSSISPGDVVVVRSGNVGTACVIPASISEGNCSDLVIIQEPICVCPEYLCFYLNSMAQAHVVSGMVGVALTHFNTKSVANMPIPLPPLAEQHRIVAKVDELMALCDQLEQQLSQADQQRRRLLEAVLAEALVEPEQALAAMT
jgi:type I restriction enzyme S subunit